MVVLLSGLPAADGKAGTETSDSVDVDVDAETSSEDWIIIGLNMGQSVGSRVICQFCCGSAFGCTGDDGHLAGVDDALVDYCSFFVVDLVFFR